MSSALNPSRKAGRSVLAALIGVALIVPAHAQASGDALWAECINNGTVGSGHTQKEFQDALTDPPADGAEYTDCLSVIGAAQKKAAVGGSNSNSGNTGGTTGGGTTGSGTGGGTGATTGVVPNAVPDQSVTPENLQKALAETGVDTAAAPGTAAPAPAPSLVGGKTIDLESERMPSIANTLSLPLPLAASAVVVMLSAALPAVRFAVGRFGAPPTGTSPSP